ncbi:MAG: hypothetical protein HYU36_17455 [Planctomycetes bacterium]|nr:hypothetical protein [Planctomycetota bacterium]
MVFRNYGGQYQLVIQTIDDLEKALQLDNTCWMATSAPCAGVQADPKFLEFLDSDRNGRIRTDEFRAAVSWTLRMLSGRRGIEEGNDVLRLEDIDTSHVDGQRLRASAVRILKNLGQPDARQLSLAQVRDLRRIRADSDENGDGIITPGAAPAPEVADFIRSVMSVAGSKPDASGEPGVSDAELVRFRQEAEAYLAWDARGRVPSGSDRSEVMVWGSDTPSASATVEAVREKLDEFFTLCCLVAIDERSAAQMRLRDEELARMNFSDRAAIEARSRAAPLAAPSREETLDLRGPINPYYREPLQKLQAQILERALGRDDGRLTRGEWQAVLDLFAPYRAWVAGKPAVSVEKLGIETLRRLLASDGEKQVRQLIEKDMAVAAEMAEIANVERLILYQQGLMRFANNFVSFPLLYDPDQQSLFQMGKLIMNGMEFTFNVRVDNRADHKASAQSAQVFVMYVEVTSGATGEHFEVATPVTRGDAQGLYRGRRGIFITPDGRVWDARVADLIVNPVSLLEAIKAPFVQLSSFVEKQADRFTTTRYADMEAGLGRGISNVDQSVKKSIEESAKAAPATPATAAPAPAAPAANRGGAMRDMLVGGGVAVAALGSSFAFITSTLSQLRIWHLLAWGIAGLSVIVTPLIVLGVLKLRRRNVSPILEASGWAINANMRITASMGHLFTHFAHFPESARKEKFDLTQKFAQQLGYRSSSFQYAAIPLVLLAAVATGFALSPWVFSCLESFFYLHNW